MFLFLLREKSLLEKEVREKEEAIRHKSSEVQVRESTWGCGQVGSDAVCDRKVIGSNPEVRSIILLLGCLPRFL